MSEFSTTEKLLEETSVRRLVIRLGLPAMFGQFFNILYNIVDRIFVGNIPEVGDVSLASIGVCAPALTAVGAFAFMVGIGGASYMSISLGEKERQRARETIGNAFIMLLIISALVTAGLLFSREKLLYGLGCSANMYPYAETYFTIYVCGTFAALLGSGLNQFILAQGYAKQGMISVVIGAAINVVLDPILIFKLGMGIAGAAWGTVISQLCMMLYVIWFLRGKEIPVRLCLCKIRSKIVLKILSIGFMSFMITLLDNFIIILLNASLRKYGGDTRGDMLITCAAVVQSFMTIVFCPAQGITTGCGTIFSFNYGAKNYQKIRQAFFYVFVLCGIYIGAMEIAVQIFSKEFAGFFLRNRELTDLAGNCLRMYTFALIGVAVQYALVDSLTSMGKIKYALPISFFRKIVYIVCIFVLPLYFDIQYIFYAGTVSDAIGATFSVIVFFLIINPRLKRDMNYSAIR
ncbi:MAG: MATE family efflux transporter [Oscillospiraceae bacterium]|nr:MATE family efflux transporter [Oscillospiraceae bacterium]